MSPLKLEPWSRTEPRVVGHWEANSRQRIRVGAALLALTLLIFACHSFFAYSAERMAGVSLSACLLSLVAFYFVHYRQETLISSNMLTASLYIQVFGEMLLNGGFGAPATPLATLIVPAAYLLCPHASRSMFRWCLVVGMSLVLVALLESAGMTLPSELTPEARRLDKLLSLVVGVLGATYMTKLFANQASAALEQLARERMHYRQQALFDSLTGLPNRDNFFAHAEHCLEDALGSTKTFHLIFLDIDRFKRINDTMGHATGDALLEQVGARLKRLVSPHLFAARLAGDEFIVMSEDTGDDLAGKQLLGRLRSLFVAPFDLDGQALTISLSAGVASFPDDGQSLEALLNIADERMYAAKLESSTRKLGDRPAEQVSKRSTATAREQKVTRV